MSVLHFPFFWKETPKTKKHGGKKKKAEPHGFQKWPSLRVTLAKALKLNVEELKSWVVEGWRVDLRKMIPKVS